MHWKKYLPIIGIILFIYILIKINLFTVLNEIKNADLYFLLIASIFVFLMMLIQTFKWFAIAVFQGIRVPFLKAFKINLMSNFYGFITPSKLGTVIRAEYLREYTGNIGKGLCNFTLDKILDLASITFMAILFSFIFKDKLELPIGFFIAVFLSFVLLTLFFINKERSKFVLRIFYKKFIPQKMKNKAKLTFDSFYDNIPRKRYFPMFFSLNLINWMSLYLVAYFVGLSVGINLPFVYYLAIMPLGTLVAMIPISINGLGTREVALISLFSIFEISAVKVFSMSILTLLIATIIPSIIAIFLIFKKKL